jgi:ribonucleoside-diphosphate reductase alpha chain
MGLGVTGVANAIEAMGYPYASDDFLRALSLILSNLRNEAYRASALLAKEKGSFSLFNRDKYMEGKFIQSLPDDVQDLIYENGIRNSHLLSIAPTGTISFCADNVSSGIEPVFATKVKRLVNTAAGPETMEIEDYGYRFLGVEPKTTADCNVDDHLKVLVCASTYVDSAVSKTCNVPTNIEWEAFKDVYVRAWAGNCKGCTTYRVGGKREAILEVAADAPEDTEFDYEAACIAAIAAKYGVALNDDGTLPKNPAGAYQRLKRLRRAHPDFKAGVSNKSSVAVPRTTRAAFEAHVLSLGLTKAQLRVLFKDTLDGLK